MPAFILPTDDYEYIAKKIWEEMKLNQSVTIDTWCPEQPGVPNGKLVLDELRKLDRIENFVAQPKGMRRKRKFKKNHIGDSIGQKAFTWAESMRGEKVVYQIWRIQ